MGFLLSVCLSVCVTFYVLWMLLILKKGEAVLITKAVGLGIQFCRMWAMQIGQTALILALGNIPKIRLSS